MNEIFRTQAVIFLVDLKVQRRRVIKKGNVNVEAQQVSDAKEDRPLDGLLVRLQEIHRPVQVLQRQCLRAGDPDVLAQPLLVAVQLGTGCQRPVGHHREQRPLDIEAQPPRPRLLVDDLANAQPLPQRLQRIDVAIGPSADQAPVAVFGHDSLGRAAAQDALGEPAQPLDDCLVIGTPTVVQNAGLGAALISVPDILGQLQVADHATVGALLLGFAQIHVTNVIDGIALPSRHTGLSMYLGISAYRKTPSQTDQWVRSLPPENVPGNCQSRVRVCYLQGQRPCRSWPQLRSGR
ncbi:MAG: hypothetical protein IPI02_18885 [Sterolibacteriaceae bacterium]|nr:hypothetical protein [Sterolibacteriaceae bacterium]